MQSFFEKKWATATDEEVIREIQRRSLGEALCEHVGEMRPTKGAPSRGQLDAAHQNPTTPTNELILREARRMLITEDFRLETARQQRLTALSARYIPGAELLEPAFY